MATTDANIKILMTIGLAFESTPQPMPPIAENAQEFGHPVMLMGTGRSPYPAFF